MWFLQKSVVDKFEEVYFSMNGMALLRIGGVKYWNGKGLQAVLYRLVLSASVYNLWHYYWGATRPANLLGCWNENHGYLRSKENENICRRSLLEYLSVILGVSFSDLAVLAFCWWRMPIFW
jgi:hypothetical protein